MALIRAVLDTNIYVSALLASKGESGRILDAGFERGIFIPVASPAILDELIDVIARPAIMRRARRDMAQLAAFHRWVERNAEVVEGEYQGLDIVPRDAKDNPIAAAALEGQVPYLVSRDEDLLSLKVLRVPGHQPVQIVGPRAFLRLLKR
jgi:putative PIN family toxin of toxin-antitoxin system